MNFQERLRELREENKYSQLELSKKLNISNVTLSQYENGVRKPDLETLDKLASFFDVTTDYLLGRSSHPQLTRRHERDIEKDLADMKKQLEEGTLRMDLGGEEVDEEIMQFIMDNMENTLILAKHKASKKFDPNKNKKDKE